MPTIKARVEYLQRLRQRIGAAPEAEDVLSSWTTQVVGSTMMKKQQPVSGSTQATHQPSSSRFSERENTTSSFNGEDGLVGPEGEEQSPAPRRAKASGVSTVISIEVTASDLTRRRTYYGRLELFSTHLAIVEADGSLQVLYSVPFANVECMQRKKQLSFPSRSFAEDPVIQATVDLTVGNGTVGTSGEAPDELLNDISALNNSQAMMASAGSSTGKTLLRITLEGALGLQVTKAIELTWMASCGNLLSQREMAFLRCYNFGDTIFTLSLLPFDVEASLAQQVGRNNVVTTVEKPVVLRFDEDFTVSIIFRPTDLDTALLSSLKAVTVPLDKVNLLYCHDAGDEMRLCVDDGRIFLFNGIQTQQPAGTAESGGRHALAAVHMTMVFLANAATQIYRCAGQEKTVTPFTYEQAVKLMSHYIHIDSDVDGSISELEFMVALGSILTQDSSHVLSRALFSLFDYAKQRQVRLAEYLHGCRVLLRGDLDDRLRFLFLLFDVKRQQHVNYEQFLKGLRTLSQAIRLQIPAGETIETWSYKLFRRIDADQSNIVDFEEFAAALTSNESVKDALKSTISGSTKAPIFSFGHPRFQEIVHILTGIELSCLKAMKLRRAGRIQQQQTQQRNGVRSDVDDGGGPMLVTTASFQEKFSYNCLTDAMLKEGVASATGGAVGIAAATKESSNIYADVNSPRGATPKGAAASPQRPGATAAATVQNSRSNFSPLQRLTSNDPTFFFNDYCPAVFADLRDLYGIDPEEYRQSMGISHFKSTLLFGSLTGLGEMNTSGRSGSFFYSSFCGRYVIKTIPDGEAKTLRQILRSYYDHMRQYPDSLLVKFTGLHALIRKNGSEKVYFVVMVNTFHGAGATSSEPAPSPDASGSFVPQSPRSMVGAPRARGEPLLIETYDLKGSTVNRSTPSNQIEAGAALKDNDFAARRGNLMLPSSLVRDRLLAQLEVDSLLLSRNNIIDYSFLLAVHYYAPSSSSSSNPAISASSFDAQTPASPGGIASRSIFANGITSPNGQEVYYFGVIDVLTDYNLRKIGEHYSKRVLYDPKGVSCIPPKEYHQRFIQYLQTICSAPAPSRYD